MRGREQRRDRGPFFSEGSRRLWLLLKERGWTQAEFETDMGIAAGASSRWFYGDRRPNRSSGAILATRYGIAADLWDRQPAERFTLPANRNKSKAA